MGERGGELAVLGFHTAELGLPRVRHLDLIELLALRDVVDGDLEDAVPLRILGGAKVAGGRYSPSGVVDGDAGSLRAVVVAPGSLQPMSSVRTTPSVRANAPVSENVAGWSSPVPAMMAQAAPTLPAPYDQA